MKQLIVLTTAGMIALLLVIGLLHGIIQSQDNRDIMLCDSAKISHNEQYTIKCACYYAGESISCINK